MRRDLFWSLVFLGFACWTASCGGTAPPPACDPTAHAEAVSAVYAKHVGECVEYPGPVDDCPGYRAAKAEVQRLHDRFVQCR